MSSNSRSDLVDIAGILKHETDRAYLFHDGVQDIWLPKSQCEWDAATKTMAMPEWLAMDKGLI